MTKKQTAPVQQIVAVLDQPTKEVVEETPYRPMAGNEALFEETLNKAYETVSYMWVKYDKPANEDTNTKEEITERWVLPMTKVYSSHKKSYFRAECMHARMEKDAQDRIERENNVSPRLRHAYKMTTDRCFRVDRVVEFSVQLRPFTEKNRHYLEMLSTYPQLRTRLGLKAIWIEVADENTGVLQHVQVLVAAQ